MYYLLFYCIGLANSAVTAFDKNQNEQKISLYNKPNYHEQEYHDEFGWLRDADHPAINDDRIKEFIQVKNAKSANYFNENSELLSTIFEEIKSRNVKFEKPATEDKHYIYK